MPILDGSIRDRFIACIKEVLANHTLKDIAKQSTTSESYLSQIQTGDRKIKPSIIANFCMSYNYSPGWILTGKGAKKASDVEERLREKIKTLTEEVKELKTVVSKVKGRELKKSPEERKLIYTVAEQQETIRDLLRALIELKAVWNDTVLQLTEEAKKNIQ